MPTFYSPYGIPGAAHMQAVFGEVYVKMSWYHNYDKPHCVLGSRTGSKLVVSSSICQLAVELGFAD